MLSYAFVGSPKTLKAKLRTFLENTGVNEIMATAHVFDHAARLRSYELFAATMKEMLTATVQ
jgi:alkanesulfonate monooxygenase SsuD/methylene tetrahydromethanopterin reductase-like flavin-dependent oxidoreductase (luciferase family)